MFSLTPDHYFFFAFSPSLSLSVSIRASEAGSSLGNTNLPALVAYRSGDYMESEVQVHFKVPCASKLFSGRFSYSTCRNDSGAATHNERRFQFRLFNRSFRVLPGFMGKSLMIALRSSTKRNNKIRSYT